MRYGHHDIDSLDQGGAVTLLSHLEAADRLEQYEGA